MAEEHPRPQFVDAPYHLATYPQATIHPDPSGEFLIVHLARQCSFWMLLIERIRRMGENAWPVAEGIVKRPVLERSALVERLDMDTVVHQIETSKSGFLSEAATYERLQQVREVARAIDDLMLAAIPPWLADEEYEGEDGQMALGVPLARHAIRTLNAVLYQHLLPLALASLWLWKTRERFKSRSLAEPETADLIRQLWIAILKLGALVQYDMLPLENEPQSAFVPHVVLPGRVLLDDGRQMMDLSVRELLDALVEFKDSVSVQCHGERTETYFIFLWSRLADIVSCAESESVHDDPSYRVEVKTTKALADRLYRTNDRLFDETERIFHYLTENEWAARWFASHRTAASNVGTPGEGLVWREVTEHVLGGVFGDFIKLEFEERVWERNGQWDLIEEYEQRTRTIDGDYRHAIVDVHQERFDVIRDASQSALSSLWFPAVRTLLEDQELYEKNKGREKGFRWRAIWELSETLDQHRTLSAEGTIEHIPGLPYDVHIPTSGDGMRYFVNRDTGKRLRDKEAEDAALLYARLSTVAGKCEYDGICESAFSILISKAKTEAEEKDGARSREYVHYWPRLLDTARERFTLHGIFSHSHPLMNQYHARNVALLRIYGNYITFDGAVVTCQTALFEEALMQWCLSVERVVIIELEALGTGIEAAQNDEGEPIYDAIDRLAKAARSIVMRIPPVLRTAFSLKRDEVTLLPLADYWQEHGSRHWTEAAIGARMRKLRLWPALNDELDLDEILGPQVNRVADKPSADVMW